MMSLVSPHLYFHTYRSAVLLSTSPVPTHSKQVHASWLQAPLVCTAQHEKVDSDGEKQVTTEGRVTTFDGNKHVRKFGGILQ